MDIKKEHKTTIILVEHDLGVVMDISDRIHVLDFGEVIGSGTPKEVAANERVIEAYIGEDLPFHNCCAGESKEPVTKSPCGKKNLAAGIATLGMTITTWFARQGWAC